VTGGPSHRPTHFFANRKFYQRFFYVEIHPIAHSRFFYPWCLSTNPPPMRFAAFTRQKKRKRWVCEFPHQTRELNLKTRLLMGNCFPPHRLLGGLVGGFITQPSRWYRGPGVVLSSVSLWLSPPYQPPAPPPPAHRFVSHHWYW